MLTLLTAALAAAAMAGADEPSGFSAPAETVRIAAADLRDPARAEAILKKVSQAATRVCTRDLAQRMGGDFHSCRQATTADALRRLDAPLVIEAARRR